MRGAAVGLIVAVLVVGGSMLAARAETSLRSAASWTEHPVDAPPLVHGWVGGAIP